MKNKLSDKMNEDALLREVVDDVKNEQLQKIWNKYGLSIIIGVTLILTAALSYESLKNWQEKNQQKLSNAYSVALSLQGQGRLDESLEVYGTLADKASGVYADLAKLQIAGIYSEQGKQEDAVSVLTALTEQASVAQMRHIAALKLASLKIDSGAPAQEIEALLQPVLADEAQADVAKELSAMLDIRENNISAAKAKYEEIASSATASDTLKARAQDMIALLAEKN